jgi:hypothetical protein
MELCKMYLKRGQKWHFTSTNHEICEGSGDRGQDDGQTSSSFHKIRDDWLFVWKQINTQK